MVRVGIDGFGMGHRVNREDTWAEILDTASWDLQQCQNLVLDGSTVTLYTRFNYELHDLSGTGYMRFFIICISLVLRYSKIKKNSYFSALTINELNEMA